MSRLLRALVIFGLALLVSSEFWSLFQSMEDEAVLVYGARRILEGQMIYRDWDTHLAPGPFYVAAGWFWLLGFQAPTTRLLYSFIFALNAVLVDLVGQRCLPAKGYWRWLPILLWCTAGGMEFPILSYHWMATAAATACLLAGMHWTEKADFSNALALGATVALAGWCLQSEGLVGLLMVGFWWLRFRPRYLVQVLAGLLLTSVVLWLPLISQWPKILYQNTHLGGHLAFNRKLYSFSHWSFFLSHYRDLTWQAGLTTVLAVVSHVVLNALRYLGLPWLACLGWFGAERKHDRAGVALAGALLAWLVGTANRHTIVYLSFLTPGWALLLTKVLQMLPRGAWLAGALGAWELCGWACRFELRRETFIQPVQTRAGLYYVFDPGQAAGLNTAFRWIRELPPQTPVLCFPYCPSFYSLGLLKNPIRRQTLVPRLDPPSAFPEALQAIHDQNVEWLLYAGPDPQEISGEYDISPAEVEQGWEALRLEVTRGYQLVAGGPNLGLYRRSSNKP
ncbi:hypothetical protein JST97_12785 [bacterium]|nr:hypothetical protein [bacterium]